MILATQYFRPPFPGANRWGADLDLIAATGFDTIYVTVPWSWVEAKPGAFRFDDFDELIALAGARGLQVICNLFAETQPLWIHRLHPNAAMVDHMNRPVQSSQLSYIHFGLTPGCCTDEPEVRRRSGAFMTAVAEHFCESPHLRLWDCWNEMRWMTQADGHVCFCGHTLTRYRRWLEARYGSLDELNRAWQRRYVDWRDVMPAKLPARTYMDAMAWQQFLTDKIAQDLRWKYECIRSADRRPIIAHAAFPSIHNTGEYLEYEPALGRGNDWQLAEQVDGYGCSHFPAWFHPSPSEYGARLEAVRCATGDKPYWLAELQGGAAGHEMQPMEPVDAARQARWIRNGIARGAKAVNFWCWRDEAFGRESGGFGIVGDDGHRDARLRSLVCTAALFGKHRSAQCVPACGRHGRLVFEPLLYQLDWASYATTGLAPPKDSPYPAGHSVQGFLQALERLQTPYDVVEAGSTRSIAHYRLLIMPWPLVVNERLATRLIEWVEAGGTLLTEASLDAFTDTGLFKYPAERPLSRALGFEASARRPLDGADLAFQIGSVSGRLRPARWREDIATAHSRDAHAIQSIAVGKGRVIVVGSFVGVAYWERRYEDFECFLKAVIAVAQATPSTRCSVTDGEIVQWRLGRSGATPVLFVINDEARAAVEFASADLDLLDCGSATELTRNQPVPLTREGDHVHFTVDLAAGDYALIRFDASASTSMPRRRPQ